MKRILALVLPALLLLSCDPPETEIAVSSVSLNRISAELKVGETLRLSATVSPADATDKTVTWSSSKASVATVSPSGEVTAVAAGKTSITAAAGGQSASCAITVVNPSAAVTSITLNKDRLDMTVGGTAKLTATVTPPDATDKTVTWESSDAGVATVDKDGNVKALKGGTSTITANAGGKSATALVDVMEITPTEVSVGAEGDDIRVTVIADRSFHISSTPDWVVEKTLSGKVYTFTVAANPETAPRNGIIVICDDVGACLPCVVNQEGVKPFSVTPMQVSVGYQGGTFRITVSSPHGYHLNSTPDWVTEKSVQDKIHTFEAGPNGSPDMRSGVITFCDDVGTCLSVTVRQEGDPSLIDWNREFYHNPFLLCLTSQGIGSCPEFRNTVGTILSKSSWTPVVANVHQGDDYDLQDGRTLAEKYGLVNLPCLLIDGRRRVEQYWGDDIATAIDRAFSESGSDYPVCSAIGFDSSVEGQELDVYVRLYLKQAGSYKVTVFVTESSIIAYQYDYLGNRMENYRHDDVVRTSLTGIDGDPFTASARSVKTLHYNYLIPSGYARENLKIVVLVQKTYETTPRIIDDGYDYGDYYVDNCCSGKAGTIVWPTLKGSVGGGNEDITGGEPINW